MVPRPRAARLARRPANLHPERIMCRPRPGPRDAIRHSAGRVAHNGVADALAGSLFVAPAGTDTGSAIRTTRWRECWVCGRRLHSGWRSCVMSGRSFPCPDRLIRTPSLRLTATRQPTTTRLIGRRGSRPGRRAWPTPTTNLTTVTIRDRRTTLATKGGQRRAPAVGGVRPGCQREERWSCINERM